MPAQPDRHLPYSAQGARDIAADLLVQDVFWDQKFPDRHRAARTFPVRSADMAFRRGGPSPPRNPPARSGNAAGARGCSITAWSMKDPASTSQTRFPGAVCGCEEQQPVRPWRLAAPSANCWPRPLRAWMIWAPAPSADGQGAVGGAGVAGQSPSAHHAAYRARRDQAVENSAGSRRSFEFTVGDDHPKIMTPS